MPYHDWGDDTFDWNSLNEAIHLIYKMCKFFRIGCHIKEKYGTIRASFYFFDGSFHSFMYPGYVYYQYSNWKMCKFIQKYTKIDIAKKLLRADIWLASYHNNWYNKLVVSPIKWIQFNFGYKTAIKMAIKKFPHIKEEIICNMPHKELFK